MHIRKNVVRLNVEEDKMLHRTELIQHIADSISSDAVYNQAIVVDLSNNYSNDKLVNAACEYTDMLKEDVINNYN